MKTKEKLIEFIQGLPEKDIEKIFEDVVKPDKTQEMSDFLFSVINGSIMKFTGKKEITYYKDNEWIIQQDYKNCRLWVSYSLIWKVFEENFGYNYEKIRNFIQDWIETNTEWRGLTLRMCPISQGIRIETNTEWRGLTPDEKMVSK